MHIEESHTPLKEKPALLALGALGIVFGDIGTSPLYALREALGNLPIIEADILGVLSLIFWSLIIIISLKYMVFVLKADNEGEGGSLALLALIEQKKTKALRFFYFLAIFSAGLLLGDAILTPAISVTSAVEGLHFISPKFSDYIIPISAIILVILFSFQSHGTGKIGVAFGPVLLLWFIVIAILGINQIIANPSVFKAINPYYAFAFLRDNGLRGYILLGDIFLVVTGGEALYADIGHFGKTAIRHSWFAIALPALILNYFGQGANLLLHPAAITNPFYLLSPSWFFLPLVILSTAATIIASQAVISAIFSLTRQAVLLGLSPRMSMVQTSKERIGQIYIPQINFVLMVGTLLVIFAFGTASAMTHAYGIAVNLVMLSVTIMVTYAARTVWHWSILKIACSFGVFAFIELAFLGANAHKFITGGWLPVSFALFITFIMVTWNSGLQYVKKKFYVSEAILAKIIRQLRYRTLTKLPGVTAIFITDFYDRRGGGFLQFLKLSLAVPENILILNYEVKNKPHVPLNERYGVQALDKNIYHLTLFYGFMDHISIPRTLKRANERNILPFHINVETATYLVEIPTVVASKYQKTLLFYSQEKLFSFLMRNYSANLNIEFYDLPFNRTIGIGTYCII